MQVDGKHCFLVHGFLVFCGQAEFSNSIMWKSSAGVSVDIPVENTDDDWETDPDFVNDVSEEEQRWGSRTVPGSGRVLDHVE